MFGLLIARYSRIVTRVPNNFMAAAVTVLAVFGTYSVQNSMSDVFVMMTLGVGMYFAMKVGFSPAPVVLGIILGPIAENNFLQGRMIGEATDGIIPYFFSGTINLVLIGLCVLSVAYSLVVELRKQREALQAGSV